MIVQEPSKERLEEWKSTWMKYKELIKPNRRTGLELLEYLQSHYSLTKIFDADALDAIRYTVTMNKPLSEKLPDGLLPHRGRFTWKMLGREKNFIFLRIKTMKKYGAKILPRSLLALICPAGFISLKAAPCFGMNYAAFKA